MSVIPTHVDSITLAVRDFPTAVHFYEHVFGFQKCSENEILARFRLDNLFIDLIKAEVLEAETGVTAFPRMPGPITIAIALPQALDVDACQARAEAAGVHYLGCRRRQAIRPAHSLHMRPRRTHLGGRALPPRYLGVLAKAV